MPRCRYVENVVEKHVPVNQIVHVPVERIVEVERIVVQEKAVEIEKVTTRMQSNIFPIEAVNSDTTKKANFSLSLDVHFFVFVLAPGCDKTS